MPDPDPDSDDSNKPKYELVCSGDACDMCAGMAGTYDARPPVPLHPNCKCRVQEKNGANVRYEVRNLQVQTTEWLQEQTQSVSNFTRTPETVSLYARCVIMHEEFDEGVSEELDWSPPCESEEFIAMLEPRCRTNFVMEIGYAGVICQAERWEIRETDEGTVETYLGEVGGTATACTGIHDATTEGTSPL